MTIYYYMVGCPKIELSGIKKESLQSWLTQVLNALSNNPSIL
jgi:hypothetical protein